MPGARNYNTRYMYETSPRKVKPDYIPYEKKKPVQKKKSTTISKKTQAAQKNKKQVKVKQHKKLKYFVYLLIGFSILFAISYRNSQINESFSELKETQEQYALLQKENEQLEVAIENNLNLSDLEQIAKEQLGMQKATSSQTKYVALPKKDHVEGAAEEIKIEETQNIFEKIIEYIMNIF